MRFNEAARQAYAFLNGEAGGSAFVDGDTVVIGSRTYTFQSTLTNVNGHIQVGASVGDSILNLTAAIVAGAERRLRVCRGDHDQLAGRSLRAIPPRDDLPCAHRRRRGELDRRVDHVELDLAHGRLDSDEHADARVRCVVDERRHR